MNHFKKVSDFHGRLLLAPSCVQGGFVALSGLHAQTERTKKHQRKEKATSSGGSDKDPEPEGGADDVYYYIRLGTGAP